MDILYTFWDNITHYKPESVHFLGLMSSATQFCLKIRLWDLGLRVFHLRTYRFRDSECRTSSASPRALFYFKSLVSISLRKRGCSGCPRKNARHLGVVQEEYQTDRGGRVGVLGLRL